MFVNGGRDDIIIQWFSSKMLHENPKLFKNIVIGPGEMAVFIKDGKQEGEVITEAKCKADLGLFARLIDKIKGTDKQLLIAEIVPKSITVPFDGYSKDHTHITGSLNLTIRVSPVNILKTINLTRESLVTDEQWAHYAGMMKQVTLVDIVRLMEKETSLIIDSIVLSQIESSEIRKDLDGLNAKIRNAIDSRGIRWVENGLNVDLARIDVSENAYEEAMRVVDEIAKAQLVKDAAAQDHIHDLGLDTDIAVAMVKNTTRIEMTTIIGEYEKANYAMLEDQKNELITLDHNNEAVMKVMNTKLSQAKIQSEIDAINGVSEQDAAIRRTDTEVYDMREKALVGEMLKDRDLERQLKLIAANRDMDIEQAFNDGKEQGKMMAEKEFYDKGFADGRNKGIEEGRRAVMADNKEILGFSTAAFQSMHGVGQPVNYAAPQTSAPQQTGSNMVACPKCQALNQFPYKYCNNCGQPPI